MERAEPSRRPPRAAASRVSLWWLLMFALGLALRIPYAWMAAGSIPTPGSDAATIDAVSWNLARGAGFSLDWGAGPHPTAIVPPVVPWLTSLIYRAVGHRTFAAVLLQCAIGALVPLLLAALGRSLFGDPVGRWSGWIAAVHPLLIVFAGDLLTETTFCAALLLALFLGTEWVRTPRGARALGTGLAWGVASLTRPAALFLPAVVAAWAWRPLGLTLGGRARLRQVGLLLLGLALAVGPWTLRNGVALRAFVPITTGTGSALRAANSPAAWNDLVARGGAESASPLDALADETPGPNEVEADAHAGASALAFIRSRSGDWPAVAAAKLARFWRPGAERGSTGAGQLPGSRFAAVRRFDPILAWSLVTLPFALWGAATSLWGARRWFQALPLLVILEFMMVAVVLVGSLRARLPVEPLVTLYVALGLHDARRRLRARRHGLTVVPGRGAASPSPGER
jgi:4-amino-4-deoxy-L-arabinose transferase-like glycosyltransferase